jgi:hypothetical protein
MAAPSSRGRRALILFLFSLQAEHEDEIEGWCARLGVDWKAYLRERRPYLTTDQVRQLASDGFVFGAHGVAHARLQNMDASSLEREVVQSCDTIRSVTGQKSVPFAFPWHGTGLDRRLLLDVLARHDFVDLYFDAGGFRPNVPQIVDRFWADIPGESNAATSNLPDLLREQWLRPEARAGADNSVP